MTIPNEILGLLVNAGLAYGVIQAEMQKHFSRKGSSSIMERTVPSGAALRTALSRLQKRGLVMSRYNTWNLTKTGRSFIRRRIHRWQAQREQVGSHRQKRLIIAFDIPERRRSRRDWLRVELMYLGFKQLQKSVWIGPAPLPDDFIRLLDEFKMLEHMKFFEAKETEIA